MLQAFSFYRNRILESLYLYLMTIKSNKSSLTANRSIELNFFFFDLKFTNIFKHILKLKKFNNFLANIFANPFL